MENRIFPITRTPNPLHVINKDIIAMGNPAGKDLKKTFTPEKVRLTNRAETKLFEEENLDNIDPTNFYKGGVIRKQNLKRRYTRGKTNKQRRMRVSKKQKNRRNKKSKSKHRK